MRSVGGAVRRAALVAQPTAPRRGCGRRNADIYSASNPFGFVFFPVSPGALFTDGPCQASSPLIVIVLSPQEGDFETFELVFDFLLSP